MIKVKLPAWAAWLDVPNAPDHLPVRHRVLRGGRGGGKSWAIAHKLIERALRGRERILCSREFQNSIRDSSKRLIEDVIDRLGLGARGNGFFNVTEKEIRGANGSTFSFMGLNGKDSAIKSLEGYTLVWVEEAATVSQSSIDALIPTIRREGSEIWWSYNPRFRHDPVDMMFRGEHVPPGSIVRTVRWNDNPWFPDVLRRDMEFDLTRDPEKHAHIWQGAYLERSEARIFNNWTVRPFEAPDDALFRFGADWGFSIDPTVLVRCFIGRWEGEPYLSDIVADQSGKTLFIDGEAYKVGCAIDETPALFAGSDAHYPARWKNEFGHAGLVGASKYQITADNARPETIDHLAKRGFRIVPAIKGKGSIEEGINFLQTYDMVVHPRCRHLTDELLLYSWATDRQTGEIFPKPADRHNHVIDALRYALEGARKASKGGFDSMSSGPRLSASIRGFLLSDLQGHQPVDEFGRSPFE